MGRKRRKNKNKQTKKNKKKNKAKKKKACLYISPGLMEELKENFDADKSSLL